MVIELNAVTFQNRREERNVNAIDRSSPVSQKKRVFATDFIFHNVGEGLFYTGQIDDFNFVYDCGAQRINRKHLNLAIGDYVRQELKAPRIDLLIISHLHDDHTYGLDALLNYVSVDTVILPYLSPVERLAVALKKINLSSWFYDFLTDPVAFLIERGINRVVLVGGREPYPPEPTFRNVERFENAERKLDWSEMPEDEDLKREIIGMEQQLQRFLNLGKLYVKSHRGHLKAKGVWSFRFFNCKVDDSKLNAFIKCVKPIVRNNRLVDVIKSKPWLKKLKKCYQLLPGDFNDTSLLVYHGLIPSNKSLKTCSLGYRIISVCSFHFVNRFLFRLNTGAGQLLTGDVNLNSKLAEIVKHYGPNLSNVGLALVPHHGARKNWNGNILTKTSSRCLWVTSAGISNKHHPSFDVIQDIINSGNVPFWSNELHKISMKWFCNIG